MAQLQQQQQSRTDDGSSQKIIRDTAINRIEQLQQRLRQVIADNDKVEAKVFLSQINEKWRRCCDAHNELCRLLSGTTLSNELGRFEKVEEEVVRIRTITEAYLKPSGDEEVRHRAGPRVSPQLPPIKMKIFSGDHRQYPSWRDSFKAMVDENSGVLNSDKFHYLMQALEGDPVEMFTDMEQTYGNYLQAMHTLDERYDKKEVRQNIHISALLSLQAAPNKDDHRSLRKTFDTINQHVRSLKTMGMDEQTFAAFLQPIILTKIPKAMVVDWTKSSPPADASIKHLMDFIQKELEALEMTAMLRDGMTGAKSKSKNGGKQEDERSGSGPSGPPTCAAAAFATTTTAPTSSPTHTKPPEKKGGAPGGGGRKKEWEKRKRNCIFCGEDSHTSVGCSWKLKKKMDHITKEGRCTKCLGKHKTEDCHAKENFCHCCSGPHHTALCEKRPPLPAKSSESPSSFSGSVTLTSMGNHTNEVLLMTATLYIVVGSELRRILVIIDGGSKRSFILEQIAAEMGLQCIGEEHLAIRPFGELNSKPPSAHQIYELLVRGTFDGAPIIPLKLRSVTRIGRMPPPRRIELAHELVGSGRRIADDRLIRTGRLEEEIDVLIGADLFYDVVFPTQVIEGGCGLRAINTRFGWMLHGPSTMSPPPRASVTPVMSMIPNHASLDELSDESFDLAAFHSLESLGIMDPGAGGKEPDWTEEFERRIKRLPDGRFSVPLP